VTSEPSLQERYSQAFQDDTGESFAAITEPDIVLSGSIFSWPVAGRAQVWLTLRAAVLTIGPAGTFTGIAIHHWPLGAVLAFSHEMGRRLDGLIEPGHFAAG
jgi:hypothetical protein